MKVRQITNVGLYLIKYFESFRATPYVCSSGYLTVGFGHVILKGEQFGELTEEDALTLLSQDVKVGERSVCTLINVPLEDYQYDALVSFTFNVGGGAMQRSTLRQKVNRQEHYAVPDEFGRWIWGGGRRLAGLVKRRLAEANLYEGD